MSCYPSYAGAYTPAFVASSTPCTAPQYQLHRSRLSIPGNITTDALFFRSKSQNFEANNIELQLTAGGQFRIYYNNVLVKTYTVTFGIGAIASLRTKIQTTDPNAYIEMPSVGYDVYDVRSSETDGNGITQPGLQPFPRQAMTGGEGAPSDASVLATIRTGPTRTVFIVRSKEDAAGNDIQPPGSEKIQQWNGFAWISYCNPGGGACPGEGTC